MDTQYGYCLCKGIPPPKQSYKVQETLHFRYLTPCLIGSFPQILRVNLEKKCQCLKPPSIAVICFPFFLLAHWCSPHKLVKIIHIILTLEGGVGPLLHAKLKYWHPKKGQIQTYYALWIQVPPKKILYPPNCTLSAFLAATWIHRDGSSSKPLFFFRGHVSFPGVCFDFS